MTQEAHERLAEEAFERGRKFGQEETKERCAKVADKQTGLRAEWIAAAIRGMDDD